MPPSPNLLHPACRLTVTVLPISRRHPPPASPPQTAPAPTTNANNHEAPSDLNPTTDNTSDVDAVPTCPSCNRNFTSHIGLLGHLGIHRMDNGE
ncbi:unnamed protein product [Schistocephalus solidus]|uniref:C2H2-type domain-containing protein n=1 Tax=Schistocephalus solidus TaxID=70667 RepID=A0A183SA91_SCHSO|nr:unnamed protein product [Schistocephalus solidus]